MTRNADVRRDEEEAEDLLEMISAELRERRFASVVRLEVDKAMPESDRQLLMRELELQPEDVYEVDGLLDLTGLFRVAAAPRPHCNFEAWQPVVPMRMQDEGESKSTRATSLPSPARRPTGPSPLRVICSQHRTLDCERPPMIDDVLAIKQTLYRTSEDSPIVKALIRAAENGKQVAVLVEVTARFDEANNIEWARDSWRTRASM